MRIGAFVPDAEVSLKTLKARLTKVKATIAIGTIPNKIATGLLVPSEWFEDALETRKLELENLIVLEVGVPGDTYLVEREVLVMEHWKVPAGSPGEAIKRVDNGGGLLDWSSKKLLNVGATLEESLPEG